MKYDVYVNYALADVAWAKWIAKILTRQSYSVYLWTRDLRPEEDIFEIKAKEVLQNVKVFMPIISEAYIQSFFCDVTLNMALTEHTTKEHTFIPVRVSNTNLKAALPTNSTSVDLFDSKVNEESAKKLLLKSFTQHGISSEVTDVTSDQYVATAVYPGGLPTINNLSGYNDKFTGRNQNIKNIFNAFKHSSEVAIKGVSGIGKTEIATEYAYRYGRQYDAIWLINAKNSTTVFNDFRSFAQKIGINISTDSFDDILFQNLIEQWLSKNKKWLLIFDNVKNKEDIKTYLPKTNVTGHILAISTSECGIDFTTELSIGVPSLKESTKFLKKYLPEATNNDLKLLVKKIGYLPRHLEQAASYIQDSGMTISAYLTLTAPQQTSLKSLINSLSDSAKQLLNLCVYMAPSPNGISLEIFKRNKHLLPEQLKRCLETELDIKNLFTELKKYIPLKGKPQRFILDPNDQEHMRESFESDTDGLVLCIKIFLWDIPQKFDYWASKIIFNQISEHANTVVNHAKIKFENNTSKMRDIKQLCCCLGHGFYVEKQYDKALKAYETARSINDDSTVEPIQLNEVTINENIARVYYAKQEYKQAINEYNKVIAVFETNKSEYQLNLIKTYVNIAMCYYHETEYDEAIKFNHKALEVLDEQKEALGSAQLLTAYIYDNMAKVYHTIKEANKSIDCYYDALNVRKMVLGTEHPDTADTLNNLGEMYSVVKEYSTARKHHQQALRTCIQ